NIIYPKGYRGSGGSLPLALGEPPEAPDNRRLKGTGEIGVKSSANSIGYIRNSKANSELFDSEGFIKTGDIGYVDGDGNWFIVGRKKNIIIQGGVNIAAREVEEMVDEFPFVRRSAAVGIQVKIHQGEQVYIFVEVNLTRSQLQDGDLLESLSGDIVRRFFETFGFRPGRVFLLKGGSIPMTYNGKIRYLQLKEDYVGGTLKKSGCILFPDY
ncbi:MAG: acyl--CoA ligase, partial [bacterium]|nr:acyl--CoA ligase [bacterium]